ncbi:MAG: AAC(3) family N-acetyltransferase [Victivallales bacterium]|nr:AAC(3) family N-acetyltransferase [Victivallales bacterium]
MMKRTDLEKALRKMGLKKNDIVLLHSSMISLGEIEGGAEAVIDAFLNVLGAKGTLVVPVFGKLGILTELVKARKNAVVSNCPLGTLAAIGGQAKSLLAGHWDADTAHGHGTPYEKIAEAGGYICLLGVDQDRNTMLHSAEALLELPYLATKTVTAKGPDGKETTKSWKFYPGPHRNFIGLDHIMAETGIMTISRIGNAQVRLINAHEMMHLCMEIGQEDPAFVLCENPSCADCVRQRAAIFADRISKESFKLSASSRLCGRYVPEMIEKLQAAGIGNVELDYVQGKACAFMSADNLKKIVDEFSASGIGISALRVPIVVDDPDALLKALQAAGIKRVVLPLVESFKQLKAFEKAGISVDFSNIRESSATASAQFASVAGKSKAKFAFSPTNFVRAGEMPFLKSWRAGRFIKTIGQLDLADCTWDGNATLFAAGNAEVKELVSILRCHNFSGWIVLAGGAPFPGDLSCAKRNFEELLETM